MHIISDSWITRCWQKQLRNIREPLRKLLYNSASWCITVPWGRMKRTRGRSAVANNKREEKTHTSPTGEPPPGRAPSSYIYHNVSLCARCFATVVRLHNRRPRWVAVTFFGDTSPLTFAPRNVPAASRGAAAYVPARIAARFFLEKWRLISGTVAYICQRSGHVYLSHWRFFIRRVHRDGDSVTAPLSIRGNIGSKGETRSLYAIIRWSVACFRW